MQVYQCPKGHTYRELLGPMDSIGTVEVGAGQCPWCRSEAQAARGEPVTPPSGERYQWVDDKQ